MAAEGVQVPGDSMSALLGAQGCTEAVVAGRGWLKAERWVMRHGVAAGSMGGLRLQEKLDRG